MRSVPALIVGGGPAGAAAAITLARGGLRPELIERTSGPHDLVCGGFLGWDALAALRRLGIDAASLGARPIHRLRLVSARRSVEARLPRPAAGLSRRCLDEALLAAAAAAGAQVRRGIAAKAGDKDRLVRLDDGEEIAAEALFLATGKHELRGLARPVPAARGEGAVGLRTAVAVDPALMASLADTIELHLFDGGYAGLLLQEDGQANFCLSVAAARLRAAGGLEQLLAEIATEAPHLGERLERVENASWLTISNVPYGWRARSTASGLFRVGDQAAVIASLAGDGIAIALTSGEAAATAHLNQMSAPDWQRRWSARAARPLRFAEVLRSSGEAPRRRNVLLRLAQVPGLAGLAARLTRIG